MLSSIFPSLRNVALRLRLNLVSAPAAALLLGAGGLSVNAQTTTSFTSSGSSGSPAISIVNSCSTAITSPSITSACGSNTGFGHSTISVPSGSAGTVTKVVVTLNGVTSSGNGENGTPDSLSVFNTSFYLVSPGGQKFELLGCTGNSTDGDNSGTPSSGLRDYNITIEDGAAAAPDGSGSGWTGGSGTNYTVKPSSYWTNGNDCAYGAVPINAEGLSLPQTDGSSTLNGTFEGGASNGNWTLYVDNYDTFFTESGADPITVDSWTLALTYNVTASVSTSTAISSGTNPSNSGSSVTFTATVSSTSTVDVGTVTFTSNGNTISCTQGTAIAVSNGQAQCTTSFTQGQYAIGASYSGGTGFLSSSTNSDVSQLVEGLTSSGGTDTFCNTGSIPLGYETTSIYPSIIKVTGFPGQTVSNVEVKLLDVTGKVTGSHLLVSPDGQHNLDFLDNAFNESDSTTGAWLNFYDTAGAYPNTTGTTGPPDNSSASPANYVASDEDSVETIFPSSGAHAVDSAVPQVPGTINYGYNNENPDETYGPVTETFGSNFSGATADGDWALYPYENFADNENIAGGWCVDLTVNTGVATTTTVTSSQNPQLTGQSVTLTATVTANGSPVISGGTVTFLENGVAPPGTVGGNNVVTLNGSGKATFTTAPLPEGDSLFVVEYSGDSSDNASQSTFTQRANDNTTLYANGATISHGPTCGATYCYCNGGAVSTNSSYKGAFTPNPSIISATNLPGTISSVSLGLNQYSSATDILYSLESMVVSPTAADLDFFSNAGYSSGGGSAQLGNYIFSDAAGSPISSSVSTLSPGTYKPTSFVEGDPNWPEPAQPYFASSSGFYTLPSAITYAAPRAGGTFTGQFENTNPNGNWALYMTEDDASGVASAANGWCVNFTENPATVSVDLSHQGDGTGTDFVQGESAAQITTVVTAGNSTGPTGDPFGNNPLKVVDTLNSAFTYESASGTGWSCAAAGQTVTCTNDNAVAQGAPYPTLTLNVNVSSSAPAIISNSVTVSGAGITSNSGSDTITVDPTPALSVSKSHSGAFSQGSTGQWNITVSNTAASGSTSGTVTVADTLPSGYTLASYTSSGSLWTCTGSNAVSCTATPGIAGGSSSTITLTVNVPSNSPTSVSNTALAWGGGDLTHTSSGSAATATDSNVTVAQVPASITVHGGGTQTTLVSTPFATPLSVLVEDAGDVPIQGAMVTFVAPSSGPSGIFNNSTVAISANTDVNGLTGVAFTANSIPGSYSVSASVSGVAVSALFSLTNAQPPAFTSASSTTFEVNLAGSFSITTSPGFPTNAATLTVSNIQNAVPGINLPSSGTGSITISGTPTAPGTETFTIMATNSAGLTAPPQNFTLTVVPHVSVSPSNCPTFIESTPASCTLTASGGVGVITLSVSNVQNAVPGLNVPGSGTGSIAISGTPTAAGTETFTLTATDSLGGTSVQNYTLTVNPPPNYVVTTNTDDATGTPSNCPIPSSGTTCTLRDALAAASQAGAGNITFDSTVFSPSNSTAQNTINLSNGTLNIPSNTSITGPTSGSGHTLNNPVTVAGGGGSSNFSVFTVNSGVIAASINGLTISNGNTSGNGGGIDNGGTLTITGSTLSGNQASNGGAIDNSGTLTTTGSTISGNTASQNGGGIIINSGTLTLTGGTLSGNQAGLSGGGIVIQGGVLLLGNSIISGNTGAASAADDIDFVSGNGYTNNGGNVVGTVNDVAANPGPINLGALANYGGPTQTMIPLPGSPAICAGLASNIPAGVTTDQRGDPNTNTSYPGYPAGSPCVDAGAVQTNYSIAFTTQPPAEAAINFPFSPAPVIGLLESGVAQSFSSGTVVMSDSSGQLAGTLSENLNAGSAVFNNLTVPSLFSGDTLTATLPLNPSVHITVQAATTTNIVAEIPATLSPSSGTLSSSQLFTWKNGAGPAEYKLVVGTVPAGTGYSNVYDSGVLPATTTQETVTIPQNGVDIYVTLRQLVNGTWQSTVYTFTEPGATTPDTLTATVSPGPSPSSSGTLTSPATFSWNNGQGPTEYELYLGTKGAGTANLYNSGETTATQATNVSIPSGGVTVWATLRQKINGVWQTAPYINGAWQTTPYTFTEPGTEQNATLTTTPPPGAPTIQLTSPSTTFYWNNGYGPSEYLLNVGTTGKGSSDLYKGSAATNTATLQATVSIPDDGVNVDIEFGQKVNDVWQYNYYEMPAPGSPTYAQLSTSPTAPATTNLTSPDTTFYFIGGVGPTEYYLWLGTGTTGATQYNVYEGTASTATSVTVTTIPDDGATIYATLFQLFNGKWTSSSYTLTAPGSPTYAVLSAPGSNTGTTPPTLLASQQFTWTGGVGPTKYQLLLGTTGAGSSNLYKGADTTATSVTVTIPQHGATVYATLNQLFNGTWTSFNYTYTEP